MNNRSMDERCNRCQYWVPIAKDDSAEAEAAPRFGRCKRNVPVMLTQDGQTYSGFPIIREDEWCGEWKQN
jgi:hypothetical protein